MSGPMGAGRANNYLVDDRRQWQARNALLFLSSSRALGYTIGNFV